MYNQFRNVPMIVFSVYQSSLSNAENKVNHEKALQVLKDNRIAFKPVIGCYKGTLEKSIIIPDELATYKIIHDLTTEYNQESVLELDEDRRASLYFKGNEQVESIGVMTCVTKKEAMSQDSWTFCPSTKRFFITK